MLSQLSYVPDRLLGLWAGGMGAPRLELGTSALSVLRSSQLSYAPLSSGFANCRHRRAAVNAPWVEFTRPLDGRLRIEVQSPSL